MNSAATIIFIAQLWLLYWGSEFCKNKDSSTKDSMQYFESGACLQWLTRNLPYLPSSSNSAIWSSFALMRLVNSFNCCSFLSDLTFHFAKKKNILAPARNKQVTIFITNLVQKQNYCITEYNSHIKLSSTLVC